MSKPDPDNFRRIAAEMGDLVAEKNEAYGNAFETAGDALKLLYPDGIRPDQYGDALALVRTWDKLMRIATKKDAFGESPWRDVAGYGILGAERDERAKPPPPPGAWTCVCGSVVEIHTDKCDCGRWRPLAATKT